MAELDSRQTASGSIPFDIGRLWLLFQRRETRHLRLYLNLLRMQNKFSKRNVVASGGPVLSLTTYGARIQTVYLAIESIAAGSLLPSRFILWLDDEDALRALPPALRRLQSRGLEIRLTENLGPHTKYFPTLALMDKRDQPLIIADDDQLYTRKWLEALFNAHNHNPNIVHCYRAHVIWLLQERIAPYKQWTSCKTDRPSMLHFATGVSGMVLPPALLRRLRERGTEFLALCPAADDIWLHANAIRAGLQTRQIGQWQRNFPVIPGTQEKTLMADNVDGAQNDVQIAKTYTPQDIALLLQAIGSTAAA